MRQVYESLLRFYPAEHQAIFAQQMLEDFNQAAADCRQKGSAGFAWFVLRELVGLLRGLSTEWIAKWTANTSYLEGCSVSAEGSDLPLEVVEVQNRLQLILRRMEFAIAHHDFPRARLFCEEERIAREHLEQMLRRRKLDQPLIPFTSG